MPNERDAPGERSSSWARAFGPVQLAFAGFVWLHVAVQAYRAASDAAVPATEIESRPWLVATRLVLIWIPFAVSSSASLMRSRCRALAPASDDPEQRALSRLEPLALGIVLLFVVLHGAEFAGPLCTGALGEDGVRSELIANLSETWRGLPARAIGYVFAVGAVSFYAARAAQRALPQTTRAASRSVVILGVLCFVLGSYAVIHCASGPLVP